VRAARDSAWRWARDHHVLLALSVTIAAAGVARFVRLDLMEFKTDEAEACRLALHVLGRHEPGIGDFFPTSAVESSVGIPNPPLFVYLLALPLAITATPLAAAAFIAATNVAAVWVCYLVGKRYFSTFVGLASAAIFAVSPWAIIYSRKIWTPNLLPICTGLFLLALHAFLVDKRPRAVLWLVLLLGVATQLHFSAWLLVVVLVSALVIGRDTLQWRWLALGLGGFLVLYAPYLWHIAVVGHFRQNTHSVVPSLFSRFHSSVAETFAIGGGGDLTSTLLGPQPAFAHPLSFALGTTAFVGLLASCRGWRTRAVVRARLLLPLWFVLPLAALTLAPVTRPYLYYFIVLYPLPFLGMAVALEGLVRRRRVLAWMAFAGCIAAFAFMDVRMYRGVAANGGAPEDYGVAYRYKADAVASFVAENPTRRFEIRSERPEYRLLTWLDLGRPDPPPLPPAFRYVIAEQFDRHETRPPRTERFGPLEVTVIPLRGN
jgi:4-amino-4-deoxy-L-arabinose transferase-like glycosyltransferase